MDNQLISDLLFGSGRLTPGSNLADRDLIKIALEEFQDQAFCIVRDWMLIDLLLPDDDERLIRSRGLKPTLVFATSKVFEHGDQNTNTQFLMSGFMLSHDGCFFQTEETLYILAGRGSRKTASKPAAQALASYSYA